MTTIELSEPTKFGSRLAPQQWGVSVVVPMFNEQDCLPTLMANLDSLRAETAGEFELEIVLVDDGSRDNTCRLACEFAGEREGIVVVRHETNRGIAAAIHTGIVEAKHPIVASIDADGTYDIRLLGEMIPLLVEGADLVTASPYHPLGRVEGVPPWRLGVSRTASNLYSRLMPQKLTCYTSCFRVYRRDAFVDFAPRKTGFVGIVELLWKAQRRGLRVAEYPAALGIRQQGQSKMRVARVTASHLRFMARIACERLFVR